MQNRYKNRHQLSNTQNHMNSSLDNYFGIFIEHCIKNNYKYTLTPYCFKGVMIIQTPNNQYTIENYYFSIYYKIKNEIGMSINMRGIFLILYHDLLSELIK